MLHGLLPLMEVSSRGSGEEARSVGLREEFRSGVGRAGWEGSVRLGADG